MHIYCMKCKTKTDTKSMKAEESNGRYMLKGTCACGCRKCQFVSKSTLQSMEKGGKLNLGNLFQMAFPQFSPMGSYTPVVKSLINS